MNPRPGGLPARHLQIFLRLKLINIKRRHQINSLSHHGTNRPIVEIKPVLNGVHPAINAIMQTLAAISMASHLNALAMRLISNSFHLVKSERSDAHEFSIRRKMKMMRPINLDQIRPILNL